ncbi:hypothetical protein D3C85_1346640 [compost metagenome]
MAGLLDHLRQALHEGQLFQAGLQWRQTLEVLLSQHGLHIRQVAGMLQQVEARADTLAHLARLAEYRHHQPLAEQKHGNEHHAEEHHKEFRGNLAHGR